MANTTNHTAIVDYVLEGSFSIITPFDTKFLSEISQRSALTMATHLFFPQPSEWYFLRPYVASYLHKAVVTNHVTENINVNKPSLNQKFFEQSYIVTTRKKIGGLKNDHIKVEGAHDIMFCDIFVVTVRYVLSIKLSCIDREKSWIANCKLAPETCDKWCRFFVDPALNRILTDEMGDGIFSSSRVYNFFESSVKLNPIKNYSSSGHNKCKKALI